MRVRATVFAIAAVGAVGAVLGGGSVAALAAPQIQAHRGGSVVNGVPTYPENTLPAFVNAAAHGWVLELDVKLTSDRVPVVIHDDTLDRTTVCSGPVKSVTAAQLVSSCPTDVLGSPGSQLGGAPTALRVPVPTLRAVLDWARDAGARVSMEIKNLPTDNDFDATLGYAKTVMDTVTASGFPRWRLVVQSFWPVNLLVAQLTAPGVATALLTQKELHLAGAIGSGLLNYTWWSPAWPISATEVRVAHLLGRRVVPYTLDFPWDVRAAAAVGVDAIITDDPSMATAAL
jgi:glycerophosphoryl diester phosphodiesterase